MIEWREEPIARRHDRAAFDCGVPELNQFLRQYARQSHDDDTAKTFVFVPVAEPHRILGYYTIRAGELDHNLLPPGTIRGTGRYPVGVLCLARLAVDEALRSQRIGRALLWAAGSRTLDAAGRIGCVGLEVDAMTEPVAAWYEHLGAIRLLDDPLHMLFSLAVFTSDRERPETAT